MIRKIVAENQKLTLKFNPETQQFEALPPFELWYIGKSLINKNKDIEVLVNKKQNDSFYVRQEISFHDE